MKVAPDAALDDGWFDVVTLGDFGFADLVFRGLDIYTRQAPHEPEGDGRTARARSKPSRVDGARGAARRRRRAARPPARRPSSLCPARSRSERRRDREARSRRIDLAAKRPPLPRSPAAPIAGVAASLLVPRLRRLRHLAARLVRAWRRSSPWRSTTRRPSGPPSTASHGPVRQRRRLLLDRAVPRALRPSAAHRRGADLPAPGRVSGDHLRAVRLGGATARRSLRRCRRRPSSRRSSMSRCEMVVPYVFPWYLAITQAWVRPVIQIADLTGPLGVSSCIVLVQRRASTTRLPRWRRQAAPCRCRASPIAVGVARAVARLRPGAHPPGVEARAPPRRRSRSASCRPTSASTRSGVPELAARAARRAPGLSAELERAAPS